MDLNEELNELYKGQALGAEADNEKAETAQRTEEWYQQRCGVFTGSRLKELMSCKSRAKGKSWDDTKWILDLGESAHTYIYEKAVERDTGNPLDNNSNLKSWQMERGAELEPEAIEAIEDKFKITVKECEFTKFMANAGASPDGNTGSYYGLEIKCYDVVKKHLRPFDLSESNDHFWQMTAEGLALRKRHILYASYDNRVADDVKLKTEMFTLSEIHCKALISRLVIAEMILRELIKRRFTVDSLDIYEAIKKEIPTGYEDFCEYIDRKIIQLEL